MVRSPSPFVLAVLLAVAPGCARSGDRREAPAPVVPAAPATRIVPLDGAKLEVIDWGGRGDVLVLVAGLGASAHAYEGFAQRFTDRFRVVGVTRRGHGASEATPSGYDTSTLAEDLRALLDDLRVERATFVAHSFGGEEVTCLAVRHPERVGGLIYLDAAYDQARAATALSGVAMLPPPEPSAEEKSSPSAYATYMARTYGLPRVPVAEVEASFVFDRDGVHPRVPDWVIAAMKKGVTHCDDRSVHAPAIAIYAVSDTPEELVPYARANPEALEKVRPFFTALAAYKEGEKTRFSTGVAGSRVVELHGANHYVWISHPREVEREMRGFLAQVR